MRIWQVWEIDEEIRLRLRLEVQHVSRFTASSNASMGFNAIAMVSTSV